MSDHNHQQHQDPTHKDSYKQHEGKDMNPTFSLKEYSYFFKTDKTLGSKRPTVKLMLPIPTVHGLFHDLQNEKVQEFILTVLADQIADAARGQVTDDTKPVNKQEDLDLSKLTLEYLANLPKTERKGAAIAKEIWDSWETNYCSVMPGLTGKTPEQVSNAAKLFKGKLVLCKGKPSILKMLQEQLNLWFTNCTEETGEEFAEVYEYLTGKLDTFIKADDVELLDNL